MANGFFQGGIPGVTTPIVNIGGDLPWGGGGAGAMAAKTPDQLAASYAKSYNDALAQNARNYQNILAGYQQTLAQQAAQQNAVQQQYANLYNDVIGGVQGIGQARNQDILDRHAASVGQQSQQLIDRGLANTTVQQAVTRGLGYDRDKALNENAERIAGIRAQYGSQLGLAGLNYAGQAAQANTALANRQLDWMNSLQAAYPDAGLYAQMAQAYGADQSRQSAPGWGMGSAGVPMSGLGLTKGSNWGTRSMGGSAVAPTGGGGGSWLMSQYAAAPAQADAWGSGGSLMDAGIAGVMGGAMGGYGAAPSNFSSPLADIGAAGALGGALGPVYPQAVQSDLDYAISGLFG